MSDAAWLQAMLDFEAALAQSEADAGLVPAAAAAEIAGACRAGLFDASEIGLPFDRRRQPRGAAGTGPDRRRVPGWRRQYVHLGATSQDVIDTAFSLMAQRALDAILADLSAAGTRVRKRWWRRTGARS